MTNLKSFYTENVIPKLVEEFKYSNIHLIPKLDKLIISTGLGVKGQNPAFLQKAIDEIRLISGQHPITTLSKKAIAGFKIRENMILGLVVTLRRQKMYSFLEKLIKLVFPRIRDFHGINPKSFDTKGNYNIGISDQLIFPEIEYSNVEQTRGFNISIVTTAKTVNEGFFLLKELGMPFIK
jgi:large subunit ribosomal protein L5